jgi:hypothetical protein
VARLPAQGMRSVQARLAPSLVLGRRAASACGHWPVGEIPTAPASLRSAA